MYYIYVGVDNALLKSKLDEQGTLTMTIPLDEFGEVVSTVTTGVNYTKWGNETIDGYNQRMAYEHFTLAADAGLADAYTNVGIMLLNGQVQIR